MSELDAGTGYGLTAGTHDAHLTEVGPGTPMGEFMRRYWQPVGLASYATDVPRAVRILGEDLVLFRTVDGRPGLVHPRCIHRGTSLLYGRVDDAGIRCCYHGWAFDPEGRCTDQPCEPQNGLNRDKFRQPWYPVAEHYGLIWAYMGPPDRKPALPRYSTLEDLADGEQLFTDDHNLGSGRYFDGVVPFNWLQHLENVLDTGHFYWLHYLHSGPQFGARYGEFDDLNFQPWQLLASTTWSTTDTGVAAVRLSELPDGRTLRTVTETVLPNVRVVSNPFGAPGRGDTLGFVVPVDDTSFRIFTVMRAIDRSFFDRVASMRRASNAEEAQRFPGDWEAQSSQGPITLHSEEHLASSDRGIRMLRRLLRDQADAVAAGHDPINVRHDPDHLVAIECGQYFDEAPQ